VDALLLTNEWLVSMPGSETWRAAYDGVETPPGWHRAESYAFGRLQARLLLPD
jgi:hypothetical protein